MQLMEPLSASASAAAAAEGDAKRRPSITCRAVAVAGALVCLAGGGLSLLASSSSSRVMPAEDALTARSSPKLTAKWLAAILRVPFTSIDVTELHHHNVHDGISGARYYKVDATIRDSLTHPGLDGVPSSFFIKTVGDTAMQQSFQAELQLADAMRYIRPPPPVVYAWAGDKGTVVNEFVPHVDLEGHVWVPEDIKAVLSAAAAFHSALWGIDGTGFVNDRSAWLRYYLQFGRDRLVEYLADQPDEYKKNLLWVWDNLQDILKVVNSHGTTAVHGDLHWGNLLKSPPRDGAADLWRISDFGLCTVMNPAVDIGTLLVDLPRKRDFDEWGLVRHYCDHLNAHLAEKKVPVIDCETDFKNDYKVGAAIRGFIHLSGPAIDVMAYEYWNRVDADLIRYLKRRIAS